MKMQYVKFSLLLSILLIIIGCNSFREKVHAPKELASKTTTNFISQPALANASIGIFAIDLNTGETLLEHNSNLSLVPASILKIVASAAALEILGPDYRFKTTLAYSGNISEARTLNGDLVLLGGGDPAFLSPRYEAYYKNTFKQIAQEVQSVGIKWINGNVIGDGSYFGPPQIADSWIWEDIGNYYGSPAYGLNIYDNTYKINFETKAAGSLAKIISITPPLPGIDFENNVTAADNNSDNAYIYGSFLSEKRVINGTIPQNRNSFSIKGSIPDPALLAAKQLLSKLNENGIGVSGAAKSNYSEILDNNNKTLLEIDSPPLSEIIFQLNMKSVNLYAEGLLLHLAKNKNDICSIDNGCESLVKFWQSAGMETPGLNIEDGSGLSRANSITAKQLVFVLQHMHNESKYSENFFKSLPVSGESGTLKSFGKGTKLEGNLKVKSGYMSRVMNYTGCLTTESGQELAVAIMVNNYNCSNSEMRKMLEQFFVSVYEMEE